MSHLDGVRGGPLHQHRGEEVEHTMEGRGGSARGWYSDVGSGLVTDHLVLFNDCREGCIAGPYRLTQPK